MTNQPQTMSFVEAIKILRHVMTAYYGPKYSWRNEIDEMCRKHPRGENGHSGQPSSVKKLYMAAFVIKQNMSRTKSYVPNLPSNVA